MMSMYQLISQGFAKWPGLVKKLQAIESNPYAPDGDSIALSLVDEADTTLEDLKLIDDNWIEPLKQSGDISLVKDEFSGTTYYVIKDLDTTQFFAYHAMMSIVVNRILAAGRDFLGLHDQTSLESKNREWSTRIWRIYPHIRRFKPIACMRFAVPLMMSMESGTSSERQMVLEIFKDLDEPRLAVKDRWNEPNLLLHSKTMTGRQAYGAE